MKKYFLLVILLLNVILPTVWAADSFVVRRIRVDGLQRITPETVYSYLPVHEGQSLHSSQTGAIISSLYKTGFFERISLAREGNVLVIKVVERPTIGQLKISGNSVIPKDKLTTVMKSVDIAEGRVYNSAVLEKIKQSLLNQYYELGRYNARVDITVTPMDRNRVLVQIVISEGLVTKVRHINIIGNHVFSEKTLDKQLEVTTPGLFTFFTQTDRFSQEKLDTSLDNLRNYYMDHGYIKFAVKSSQVAMTPDRKSIYITVVIDEGEQYKVKGYAFTGDSILSNDEMSKLVTVKKGDVFSRQSVINSEKAISDALGDKGYVFAAVSLEPNVDEAKKEVFLTFNVKTGRRAYVRHIYFSENTRTNDVVLRRELLQMESSVVSTGKLAQSKQRLSQLAFLKDVQMTIVPVQNSNDQVDVNYKVTEDSAAQANFSIGYSQLDGVILGAGLNQKNFLGTGKTVGLNFTKSKLQQYYGINYTDPYYTPDGISRSINISASKFDPTRAGLSHSYSTDQYDASVVYGIPIWQEQNAIDRLQLGYGYENTLVNLSTRYPVSTQVQDFVNQHGRHFAQIDLIAGISRDSRDKAIFPTKGTLHTLGLDVYLPATSKSLKYYTVAYNGKWYFPLNDSFIATARGQAAYGTGFSGAKAFPFFKNYYAGGIDSVRGYEASTLGPEDSNGDPSGGNLLLTAGIGLIFPNHISDNLRTSLFVDGGNVYNTYNNRPQGGTASGTIRYSTGVEADWLTPLGLVDVSLAKPINLKPGDNQEMFQFSLGANFG
jgi:outer membrane protein insertion porin family